MKRKTTQLIIPLKQFPVTSQYASEIITYKKQQLVGECTEFQEGNGNLLLYSCLNNSTDRGAWWATGHGVTKSWTQLSDFHSLMHWTGAGREERLDVPYSMMQTLPVSYNMSTAEGSPKQACANSSFVSIKIPLSLPMMSKGGNCPLQGSGLSGPSDQVRRARGQQSMRGWPAKGKTDVPHTKQASTGWEELRSLYFFPHLLLHWTLKTPPLKSLW